MISRMNLGYSERIHVTNHNLEWRNCVYAAPSQMAITQEITRSKAIGQPINPFIGIAEDFVSFTGRYSDYFTVTTRSVATQAEQYLQTPEDAFWSRLPDRCKLNVFLKRRGAGL